MIKTLVARYTCTTRLSNKQVYMPIEAVHSAKNKAQAKDCNPRELARGHF
jgi:hypothetical protein